jgi:hypothetical protein
VLVAVLVDVAAAEDEASAAPRLDAVVRLAASAPHTLLLTLAVLQRLEAAGSRPWLRRLISDLVGAAATQSVAPAPFVYPMGVCVRTRSSPRHHPYQWSMGHASVGARDGLGRASRPCRRHRIHPHCGRRHAGRRARGTMSSPPVHTQGV